MNRCQFESELCRARCTGLTCKSRRGGGGGGGYVLPPAQRRGADCEGVHCGGLDVNSSCRLAGLAGAYRQLSPRLGTSSVQIRVGRVGGEGVEGGLLLSLFCRRDIVSNWPRFKFLLRSPVATSDRHFTAPCRAVDRWDRRKGLKEVEALQLTRLRSGVILAWLGQTRNWNRTCFFGSCRGFHPPDSAFQRRFILSMSQPFSLSLFAEETIATRMQSPATRRQ